MSDGKKRKPYSIKQRFDYWFDNRMSKGSLGFVRTLIAVSIGFAILIALVIILFRFNEEGQDGSVVWDSIANMVNNEMPYYADGGIGYILLMAFSAIIGVLFTSTLIGIITSAIEGRIDELKRGNSPVLEEDHIVVLGFYPGEYTLINQLILAAAGNPDIIVLGGDMERDEMEEDLKNNLENVPKNFRIICRKVDITDPSSIEKCSIETCRTVIVSPSTDDSTTTKAVLAVSALMKRKNITGTQLNAIVSKNEHRFPPSLTESHNICTLQTNEIIAKMVAHSCTQTGLSETFREVFNFEGSEFYLTGIREAVGLTFEEIMVRMNEAVPVGIYRDEKIVLNPPADFVVGQDDRIIVFAEEKGKAKLTEAEVPDLRSLSPVGADYSERQTGVVIFGYNETLPLIFRELPEHVNKVSLIGQKLEEKVLNKLQNIADDRKFQLNLYPDMPETEEGLVGIADFTEHIIILSDHDKDPEEADMDVVFLLLNLRDIRTRYHLGFNITVEMQKEHNQKLAGDGDRTDFLVSSSMSSLILAQLAESPELISAFREILSNRGNELYLKNAYDIKATGTWKIRDLRRIVLHQGYILLGYLDSDYVSHFNPNPDDEVRLEKDYSIIVLGEN